MTHEEKIREAAQLLMNLQLSFMSYSMEDLYFIISDLIEPVTLEEIKNHMEK